MRFKQLVKSLFRITQFLFIVITLIVMNGFASAQTSDSLRAFVGFEFDIEEGSGTTSSDVHSNLGDATFVSTPIWTANTPLKNQVYSLSLDTATDESVGIPNDLFIDEDWSIVMWFKSGETDATEDNLFGYVSSNSRGIFIRKTPDEKIQMWSKGNGEGSANSATTAGTYFDDDWHILILTYDAGIDDLELYIDNSSLLTDSNYPFETPDTDLFFGARSQNGVNSPHSTSWRGEIDYFIYLNKTLNQSEVNFFGEGNSIGLESTPTFSQSSTATDTDPETEDTSTLLNLSVEWACENCNATGTDTTIDGISGNLTYNGTLYTPTVISSSYGVNGSVDLQVNLTTPIFDLNNTQINYIWRYELHNGTSNPNPTYIPSNKSGTQNIIFKYPRLNVSVVNSYTNNSLNNFSGTITKGSYNQSFNTTTGSTFEALVNGSGNYSVYVEAPDYAINNNTNFQSFILDSSNLTTRYLSFGLFSSNSVYVYVYEESSGSFLNETTIDLIVSGDSFEQSIGVNGSYLVEDLVDGVYSFKFDHANYSLRSYQVEVADLSFQYLNAYMQATNETVVLTFKDQDTSSALEGVSISMSKLINDNWAVVESELSDITGKAQFSYSENVKYRFYASSSDYNDKTFDLDPVLFDSYNVLMSKTAIQNETLDFLSVSVGFTPKNLYNDAQNNLTLYFIAPSGNFESYSYNISYPSGSVSGSGVNAIGENFDTSFNISGAGFYDVVNVSISYDITVGDPRTYNYIYNIKGGLQSNNTYVENLGETYGLGVFERVLISSLMILTLAGVMTMFLGSIAGLSTALLFMGIFSVIGFYPIWLFLISALAGTILIIKAVS